jgi:hypothetical protein
MPDAFDEDLVVESDDMPDPEEMIMEPCGDQETLDMLTDQGFTFEEGLRLMVMREDLQAGRRKR